MSSQARRCRSAVHAFVIGIVRIRCRRLTCRIGLQRDKLIGKRERRGVSYTQAVTESLVTGYAVKLDVARAAD